jgi:hypothetical protein
LAAGAGLAGLFANLSVTKLSGLAYSSVERLIFDLFMKRTIFTLATAVGVLAGAHAVLAGPFNSKDVAADPALLVHIDFDALRSSSVGKSILSEPEVQDKLAAVGAIFDFDLRKQLHGVTVYTTEQHPKDGALIVYADFDPDRLVTLAKGMDGYRSETNGSHVIHSWVDAKKKAGGGRVCGAISGHRVVFGQDETHLADALNVIDGKSPSFAGKNAFGENSAGESVLAQGLLLKFDFDNGDQNAAILKMSKSVRLKVSEAANNMTAAVRFEAADAETGQKIANIAQGLLALLQLQTSDPNATKLANAIMIKQDGVNVGLTLSVPSSEIINAVKEGQKKAEEKAEAKEAKAEAAKDPSDNK